MGNTAEPIWESVPFVGLLRDEYGYTDEDIRYSTAALSAADRRVQEWLALWWETGSMETPPVAGHTLASLMKTGRFASPPAALLMLDWLLRDPEAAKASLARPRDRLV